MEKLLVAGLALMLVFEGIIPFVSPQVWRETFKRIIELSDGQIRFTALCSMLIGLAMLFFVM